MHLAIVFCFFIHMYMNNACMCIKMILKFLSRVPWLQIPIWLIFPLVCTAYYLELLITYLYPSILANLVKLCLVSNEGQLEWCMWWWCWTDDNNGGIRLATLVEWPVYLANDGCRHSLWQGWSRTWWHLMVSGGGLRWRMNGDSCG